MSEQSEISAQNRRLVDATKMDTPIPDRRGPLVYDLTFTESLNGIDPNFQKLPGGGKDPR